MGITLGTLIGMVIGITLCYWIAKGFLNACGNVASKISGIFKKK